VEFARSNRNSISELKSFRIPKKKTTAFFVAAAAGMAIGAPGQPLRSDL
jgi:hypothetical protein